MQCVCNEWNSFRFCFTNNSQAHRAFNACFCIFCVRECLVCVKCLSLFIAIVDGVLWEIESNMIHRNCFSYAKRHNLLMSTNNKISSQPTPNAQCTECSTLNIQQRSKRYL